LSGLRNIIRRIEGMDEGEAHKKSGHDARFK